jgi:CheY-like chemotaxis protein
MSKRILVIEDNPVNLELLTDLLEAFGFTVLAAHGGAQGIELVRQEKLDLIICDIQMPGMDGYEVAAYLKRDPMLRRIPLVAVTALAMVGDREKVLAAGFDGYIDKPISPELFKKQVEGFMEK